MYHPAAALRQASLRETLFRDMEGVPAALLEARRLRAERPVAVAAAESALPDPILSTHAAEPSGIGPEPGSVDSDPTDQLGLF
jgi:hypothetical protein